MKACISEATTLPHSFAEDVARLRRRRLPGHGSLADQAGNAPGKALPRRHAQAAGGPPDDPGRRLLPGRPAAVAGRAAQGPLRPLQAAGSTCARPSASRPCSSSADFVERVDRTGLRAGGGLAGAGRPVGGRRSTSGWPWSSAARLLSVQPRHGPGPGRALRRAERRRRPRRLPLLHRPEQVRGPGAC